ncbi:serine hydrolase [Jannaschia sp. LMIT008]|uniref:serine hydrolase domain-containing protein n=1 Tax=Jannaschia maritima TaxID=3032585 RepID=UPI00281133CB|nr:serine hydrolase [Jannaschia sp. LMIT008]
MNVWVKRAGLALLTMGLGAGATAVLMREELTRLWAVNTLFDEDRIVDNFSHMDRAFLTASLPGGPVAPLPVGPDVPLPPGAEAWIADRAVTGLIVLSDGAVTHESHHLGTGPNDRRISWSVAKSFLSLLTGILIEEGAVALDDPITRHVPALAGSAYDGATLEDVLRMESGIAFDEDYLDPDSDINRMGRALALGGALDDFTADLTGRDAEPGVRMQYVSMDTHVVGMVLRGATGQAIPDLMAEKLTGPMGLSDAYYLTDGDGTAFVLGGLNLRLRDYARMGLLLANDGHVGDRQIVPAAWIDAATTPSARTPPGAWGYGYQFWIPPGARPGEVVARGIYGQFVYVDRVRNVVVVVTSADRGFREPGVMDATVDMLRAIADAQDVSG